MSSAFRPESSLPASQLSPTQPSVALVDFCRKLDVDAGMSAQVKMASTPDQIVALAEAHGFGISRSELRVFSSQLRASYFPWSDKSRAWRHQFFANHL